MPVAAPPKSLVEITPGGEMRLHFHAGQARAWRSDRRFVLVLSGTQGGKTSFGPHWLYREIRERGPGDYLAVTSTFPLLKLKMLPEFLRLFHHTLHLGEWHGTDKIYTMDGGETRIIFGSATHPESLESATAKAAWLDEMGQDQFRLESWEAIQRRLSIHQGRVLGTTTPYNLGWLKQQLFDRWRDGDTTIAVVQFESRENPSFPAAEYERARETLPAWKFDLFYRGHYAKPSGLIYADYRDEPRELGGHLVQPFALPPEWPRYVGVDFGAVNTALVWLAHDPSANVYYAYRESLGGGKTTRDHVADALALAQGVNVRQWWAGAKSETQQRMDWRDAGIWTLEPPIADVEAGIDRVVAVFKASRLYVFDSLKGLRDELGTYQRQTDSHGEPTEAIRDKASFHRLDALRYVVQGIMAPDRTPDFY